MAPKKEKCPDCGRSFASGYLTAHRRTVHGVRGGKSGVVRRSKAERNGAGSTLTRLSSRVQSFRLTQYAVLIDGSGQLWLTGPLTGAPTGSELPEDVERQVVDAVLAAGNAWSLGAIQLTNVAVTATRQREDGK
jgi:hypothetical protein